MEKLFAKCVSHILFLHRNAGFMQQLTQDLYYSVRVSSRENIEKVLRYYKQTALNDDSDGQEWLQLEIFTQILCDLPNLDEKRNYLEQTLSSFLDKEELLNNVTLSRQHEAIHQPRSFENSLADSFENLERLSDKRSIYSLPIHRQNHVPNDTTLSSLAEPYFSSMVSHSEIMQSVPYLLLGTSSRLFEVKEKSVIIPSNIPNGETQLLHNIIEAGLLFLELSMKIRHLKEQNTNTSIKTAFLSFLELKLREYNTYVNIISSGLKMDDSLSTVYQRLYPEILKLRIYHSSTQNFDTIKGEDLLHMFDSWKFNGDLMREKLASDAMMYLLVPYIDNMRTWLTRGKIRNNTYDFFVTVIGYDFSNAIIEESKIPSFIPHIEAHKIYMIGRTLSFLEMQCNEAEWVSSFTKEYEQKHNGLSNSMIDRSFYLLVDQQYHSVNNRVNKLLKERFFYLETITLLKDLLLMGKGDFIDQIIKNSHTLFSQPAHSLESYQLTQCLQTSVQQSSMKNWLNKADDNVLLNKLDARLLELGHGSIGWDVFTLDYLIEPPLSSLVEVSQPGSKREYLRIFNFLWRIKKNNYVFEEEWGNNSGLVKILRKMNRYDPFIKDLLRKVSMINSLKNQLHSFIKKIERYCFFNIIEENYKALMSNFSNINEDEIFGRNIRTLKSGVKVYNGIPKPNPDFVKKFESAGTNFCNTNTRYDINNFRTLHNSYLTNILSSPLLHSSKDSIHGKFTGQPYPTTLVSILDSAWNFGSLYAELNNVLHEMILQLNLGQSPNHLNQIIERFNIILKKLLDEWKEYEGDCNAFIKDLKYDQLTDMIKLSKILH